MIRTITNKIRSWFGLPPKYRLADEVRNLNQTLNRINRKLEHIGEHEDPLKQLISGRNGGDDKHDQS
jgi:hypothetical protein